MKYLLLTAFALSGPSARARDYFDTVDELSYTRGKLSVSVADGCRSRALQAEIVLGKRSRGPSPVNPRFEIWHQEVKVRIFTDESQGSCRMLSYSELQEYPLNAELAKLLEGREPAAIHIQLPEVR